MDKLEKYLFGNVFMDKRFTTVRLVVFAQDTLNRFNYLNDCNEYDSIIVSLKDPLERLQKEVEKVAFSVEVSKKESLSPTQFINFFKKIMIENEYDIANAVGGYDSPAYYEFYPFGAVEYKKVSRATIPFFINRVHTVADANRAQLSSDLLETLKGFKYYWEHKMKRKKRYEKVSEYCKQTREEMEIALIMAIHFIALKFPANIFYCGAFFDFSLLYDKNSSSNNDIV